MNRLFVRDLVLVVIAMTAITTLALATSSRRTLAVVIEPRGVRGAGAPPGERLFQSKGCVKCHTVDGSRLIGPSFLHDYGSRIVLDNGTAITMDETYIRESLADPQAKARPGYPPSMPSFAGLLKEREIDALVDYIESLQ